MARTDTALNLLARNWSIKSDRPASYYGLSDKFYKEFKDRYAQKTPATQIEHIIISGVTKKDIYEIPPSELSELLDLPQNKISDLRRKIHEKCEIFGEPAPNWDPKAPKKIDKKVENAKEEVEKPIVKLKSIPEISSLIANQFADKHEPGSLILRLSSILQEVRSGIDQIDLARDELFGIADTLPIPSEFRSLANSVVAAEKIHVMKQIDVKIQELSKTWKEQELIDKVKKLIGPQIAAMVETHEASKNVGITKKRKVYIYAEFGNNGFKVAKRAEELKTKDYQIKAVLLQKNRTKVIVPSSAFAAIAISDSIGHAEQSSLESQCKRHGIKFILAQARFEGPQSVKERIMELINEIQP